MKSRVRIALLALVAVVVAGATSLWAIGAIDGARYAGVVSIERDASFRDPKLLAEAERQPVAVSYLSHRFEYQHNASVCGPTSAADLLHSIGISKSQEQIIADGGLHTLFGYVIPGLTLDEEAQLLRQETGARVAVLRGLDIAAFRSFLEHADTASRRFIVNFHRGPMFGRGGGHFSPILGYLPGRDLVLLGDVNRNYGIYLVGSQRLFDAMNTVDPITGEKRGLLMVSL